LCHLWAFMYISESIWGCLNGPNMAKNSMNNLFSGCLGQFLLKEWA
jgi:hypothetical protein